MQNWVSAFLDESFLTKRNFTKGLIIVGPGWIALAPFGLRGFRKSKNKKILKVTALYVIWNPKSVKCPASISENPVPLFDF